MAAVDTAPAARIDSDYSFLYFLARTVMAERRDHTSQHVLQHAVMIATKAAVALVSL